MPKSIPLLSLLNNPGRASDFSEKEWEMIIRQARAANLLCHVHHLMTLAPNNPSLPEKAWHHLTSAAVLSNKQAHSISLEIEYIQEAFSDTGIKLVLLKGAAYHGTNLKVASGRLLADIDILVPKDKLPTAEKALALKGWFGTHHDNYEERYYRDWMHEIPPLNHVLRQSSLDVHHTILPPTAKYHPDPEKLLSCTHEIEGKGIYVLSPTDMVIHSATHLFHEGEFNHGLRDLVDIRSLVAEFSETVPKFWEQLIPRAIELDLIRPTYYALRYAEKILCAPLPEPVKQAALTSRPNKLILTLMDFLFMRALLPDHSSCDQSFTGLSRWFLYIRSHYLRMPLHLLLPHLIRKSWKKRFAESQTETKIAAHEADDIGKNPL